jgi:IS30 family transposase
MKIFNELFEAVLYFPKKTDFIKVKVSESNKVMDKLNNSPRKTLGYKTPNEIFFGIKPSVALVPRTRAL